jgi:hypothetical protein
LEKLAKDKERAAAVVDWLNKSRVGQKLFDPNGKLTDGVKKYKPWGKVNAAKKVSKAAEKVQWATSVMGPAVEMFGVVKEQSDRAAVDKRRRELRDHYADVAVQQQDSLVAAGEQYLREWLTEVEDALDELTRAGTEIAGAREAALKEIGRLRDETEKLVERAVH